MEKPAARSKEELSPILRKSLESNLIVHVGFNHRYHRAFQKAKEIIQLGEIVYWPTGKVIAIGFGKTPISLGDEIRLASKCNVWANTNFDLKKLVNVRQGEKVLVEKSRI